MAKSVKPKRKRGRPATGRDPFVGLRLQADYLAWVDENARANGVGRSEFLRTLLHAGEKALTRRSRREERREAKAAAQYAKATAENAKIVEAILAGAHDESEPESAPVVVNPRARGYRRRQLTPEEVKAAADRAMQRAAIQKKEG
jgi:hypothetical protein